MECTNKCQVDSCNSISVKQNSILACGSSSTLERSTEPTYSPKLGVGAWGVKFFVHCSFVTFAVCSSKVGSCFYRGACQFELCTIISYHGKHDPIIVYFCKSIITQ